MPLIASHAPPLRLRQDPQDGRHQPGDRAVAPLRPRRHRHPDQPGRRGAARGRRGSAPAERRRPSPSSYAHMGARRVIEVIGRETWDDYFTFAVERNPFDVVASSWRYSARKPSFTKTFAEFVRTPRRLDRLALNERLYRMGGAGRRRPGLPLRGAAGRGRRHLAAARPRPRPAAREAGERPALPRALRPRRRRDRGGSASSGRSGSSATSSDASRQSPPSDRRHQRQLGQHLASRGSRPGPTGRRARRPPQRARAWTTPSPAAGSAPRASSPATAPATTSPLPDVPSPVSPVDTRHVPPSAAMN